MGPLSVVVPACGRGQLGHAGGMETELIVRDEGPADIGVVDQVVREAFDGRPNEVELVQGLRAATQPPISRVAVHSEHVVGHVMVSPLALEGSDASVVGLAPLSVAPRCQGRGIGTRLTDDALRVAEEAGASMIVVLGDPAYYRRFGFEPAGAVGVEAPAGVPIDAS